MPSAHGILCVLSFVAAYVALSIVSARQDAKQARELEAHAGYSGWVRVDPARVPWVIAPDVHRHKPSLVMMRPGETGDVWFVWHHWSTGGGRTARRHDRSRFIALVPSPHPLPAVAVKRRHWVGAWYLAARGIGVSDGEFNRAFTISPPADRSARAFICPAMRAALLSGAVPPFELRDNVVWIDYDDRTTPYRFNYRTQAVAALLAMLRASRSPT